MRLIAYCSLVVLWLGASPVWADWQQGDPFKMLYPQLPNPNGWDVQCEDYVLADDFQCTQTGPITDVHLWFSIEDDNNMAPVDITSVWVGFYSDAAVTGTYSRPGGFLWGRTFVAGSFSVVLAGTGDQGWYDPVMYEYPLHDHTQYYQVNITSISDALIQEQGAIYWLAVELVTSGTYDAGWKTSISPHFQDDAVYWHSNNGWTELRDPLTGESLDLAFVITPEPCTLAALAAGSLLILRRRRR